MKMLELFPREILPTMPVTVEEMFGVSTTELHDWSIKPRQTKTLQTENGLIPDLPNPADREFWGDVPPLAVFLATGSERKATMAARQATQLRFPGQVSTQLELQAYFETKVANGNKSFVGRVLLNYLHGVPVFAETQDGETLANDDPVREAINKVTYVHQRYRGMNVMVLATDTVDQPDTSDQPLGKPMYRQDFPQASAYEDRDEFWAARREYKSWTHQLPRQVRKQLHNEIHLARPRRRGRQETDTLAQAEQAYLQVLKYAFFAIGTTLTHTNAVAILDGWCDQLSIAQKVQLFAEVTPERFDHARAKRDSAGAGIMQDMVDWSSHPEKLLEIGDDFTQQVFKDLPPELVPWALYCTITGSPFWQMKALLVEAIKQRIAHPVAPPPVTRRRIAPVVSPDHSSPIPTLVSA